MVSDDKKANLYQSNNPYSGAGGSSTESDAALAARLQREEDARAGGRPLSADRGESDSYYGQTTTGGAGAGAGTYPVSVHGHLGLGA